MRGLSILGKGIIALVVGAGAAAYSACGESTQGASLRPYESVRPYVGVAGAGILSLGAAMTGIGLVRQEEARKD